MRGRKREDPRGVRFVKREERFFIRVECMFRQSLSGNERKRRRRAEAGQIRAPMCGRSVRVLVVPPCHIPLIRGPHDEVLIGVCEDSTKLLEQDRQAPAVEQNVVKAQRELPTVFGNAGKMEPDEWRRREVELLSSGQQTFEALLVISAGTS